MSLPRCLLRHRHHLVTSHLTPSIINLNSHPLNTLYINTHAQAQHLVLHRRLNTDRSDINTKADDVNIIYTQQPPTKFNEPLFTEQAVKSTATPTIGDNDGGHKQQKPGRLYKFGKYTVITLAGGYLAFRILELFDANTGEKIRRLSYFWSRMLPIYLHYKWVQKVQLKLRPPESEESEDAIWTDMHERYADTVLNLVLHQRGVYIKLAQIGAVKPDIVPKAYCKRFEILQDGVPPQPGSYARTMIEHAFGRSVESLFSEFQDKALGSATIGQVHAARMHTGQECVVKIQYPEVRRLFASDMSTLKAFVRMAQPEHLPMFAEMANAFEIEFDFEREAKYMDQIHDVVLHNSHYNRYVDIPHSIDGLVSQYVLVMTKLDGIKLIDGLKREQAKMAKKQGKTPEQLEAEMKEKMLQNKPPDFKAPNPYLIYVYSAAVNVLTKTTNVFIALFNYTIGMVTRHPLQYKERRVIINPVQIIDLLNDIHSYELFVSGVVNCDPHPGNILLLNNGKIGLIDYGQTQIFTIEHRCKLARMIQLLAKGDEQGIAAHYAHMGLKTRKMDPYVINKLAQLGFNDDSSDVTEGMNAQLFFEQLGQRDETLVVPDGYLMASRIGMLLRGLGSWIGVKHTTAGKWLTNAETCLNTNKEVWDKVKCC